MTVSDCCVIFRYIDGHRCYLNSDHQFQLDLHNAKVFIHRGEAFDLCKKLTEEYNVRAPESAITFLGLNWFCESFPK